MRKKLLLSAARCGLNFTVAAGSVALCSAMAIGSAHAQVAAANTADQSAGVETVVVTAQFRQQNLQQTPLAITAITGAMLEARGETSLVDVTASAPNVVLLPQQQGAGKSLMAYIRGVGQSDFNPAVDPGVGIYLDDVYYSSLTGADFALIDLDRVEVLRGPQGTLAGMNSLGGAVELHSREADGRGGYIEGSYGSDSHVGVKASADFTVIPDQLFVRVSGASVHQDGYVTMLDYACSHPQDPEVISGAIGMDNFSPGGKCKIGNQGSTDYTGVRTTIRWLPTPKLEAVLTVDGTQDDSTVTPTTLLEVTGTINTAPYMGYNIDNRFVPYGPYRGDSVYNNAYITYANFLDPGVTYRAVDTRGTPGAPNGALAGSPVEKLTSYGASLVLNYQFADDLSLKSISSWRAYKSDNNSDPDGTPADVVLDLGYLTHHQVTQELRLTGAAWGDLLDYTLGGIYLGDKTFYDARVNSPFVPYGTPSEPTFDFIQNDPTADISYGVYGHTGWHPITDLTIDLGLRYTTDEKAYTFYRYNPDGTTPYLPLSNPANPLNGHVGKYSGSHVDYRADVNYQWTPDIMTYAQFSTGFKGGGISPRPYFPQQAVGFGPETMNAYEVGLKSEWWDHRIRANFAGFYNQYNGYQAMADANGCVDAGGNPLPPPYNTPCGEYLNVGNAIIKGGEGEFELRPIDRLAINGSISYLDFNFVKSFSPSVTVGATAPAGIGKWKWGFGVQYDIPVLGEGTLTPRIDVSHMPGSCGDLACTAIIRNEPYTPVNMRLTYNPGGDLNSWQIAFEMTNAFDETYYMQKFNAGSGFIGGEIAPPREWTINLRKDF